MAISASDDKMARDIVFRNKYDIFMENKQLMLAWLAHRPDPALKPPDMPNDQWIPFLFFVRNSCYRTMFDVAYDWMGHDAFAGRVRELIAMNEIYPGEMLYMTNNNML